MSAVYVYGVVGSGTAAPPDGTGVSEAEVRLLDEPPLAALVSTVPESGLRVRRRDLRAHLDVLTSAFETTTVVPCRFGTVLESEQAVRDELLVDAREQLLELLDRLEGRAQLSLRAVHDEETVLREIVLADPEIARLRERTRRAGEAGHDARLRLGELVAAAVAERAREDAELVLEAVAPSTEGVVVDEPGRAHVLKASLLVGRDRVAEVERALQQVAGAAEGRLRFELLGPLPPTAFVEPIETQEAAWA